MGILGDRLGELQCALWQAVKDSSLALATEAVKFTLVCLWSRIPDLPLEEVLDGVIPGYEREARDRTRVVVERMVDTFAPEAAGDPPAGDDSDPAAQPVDSEEGADAGQ